MAAFLSYSRLVVILAKAMTLAQRLGQTACAGNNYSKPGKKLKKALKPSACLCYKQSI